MSDKRVTYETAKLCVEKGFVPDVRPMFYTDKGDLSQGSYMYNNEGELKLVSMPLVALRNGYIDAPTQTEIQTWLRDKHNIELFVMPIFRDKCGYDSFKRDGFGYEIISNEPCQYLDWTMFEQCAEEIDRIYEGDEYEDLRHLFVVKEKYEEVMENGLIASLKLIK